MALTDSQRKANDKYKKNHIKRIPLDVQLEYYEELKQFVEKQGYTMNGFIKAAIQEKKDREIDNTCWHVYACMV